MPDSVSPPQILRVDPRRVFRILGALVLLLALAHFAVRGLLAFGVELGGYVYDIWPKVDMDAEANVPTWFAASLHLIAAALLGLIGWVPGAREDKDALHWKALSLMFLCFSIDEASSLHELLIEPLQNGLHLHGLFYFAWVAVGILFVLAVGAAYLRFFLRLPPATRRGVAAAAALFLGGALGMEMLDGLYAEGHGLKSFAYSAMTVVEEVCEMAGLVLFIRVLLEYLAGRLGELRLRPPSP